MLALEQYHYGLKAALKVIFELIFNQYTILLIGAS
jgi:hypothetical protein